MERNRKNEKSGTYKKTDIRSSVSKKEERGSKNQSEKRLGDRRKDVEKGDNAEGWARGRGTRVSGEVKDNKGVGTKLVRGGGGVAQRGFRDKKSERSRMGRVEKDEMQGEKKRFEKRLSLNESQKEGLRQKHYSKKKQLAHRLKHVDSETELRLNRYISMSGVCSRREADELIKTGRVQVNGKDTDEVGIKVKRSDEVTVDGVLVVPEKKVYLVLNKPKDYVTTVDDPLDRKTVMALIEGACKERVYPVGRLDRQTTGVLLFTNDGDLSKKLTHPSYEHKKIYHVFLDKPLLPKDLETIKRGVELEDGLIKADEIDYVTTDQTEVGIEIHSGRNRIVRRIFESLGYDIVKLDRVYFAGITKKNLPRGRWRFLTREEVRILKIY